MGLRTRKEGQINRQQNVLLTGTEEVVDVERAEIC
jgi:hypothetical protein